MIYRNRLSVRRILGRPKYRFVFRFNNKPKIEQPGFLSTMKRELAVKTSFVKIYGQKVFSFLETGVYLNLNKGLKQHLNKCYDLHSRGNQRRYR